MIETTPHAFPARSSTPYASGSQWRTPAGYGVSPDTPVAGFYRARLRSGGMMVGIRIWYGAPHDPVTGDEMDRSHRWQAEANGRYIELDHVWPGCAGEPIDQAEHDHLKSLQDWAVNHAPASSMANPYRKADLLTMPLPF